MGFIFVVGFCVARWLSTLVGLFHPIVRLRDDRLRLLWLLLLLYLWVKYSNNKTDRGSVSVTSDALCVSV